MWVEYLLRTTEGASAYLSNLSNCLCRFLFFFIFSNEFLHVTLDLIDNRCPIFFSLVWFEFHFQEITLAKMQVFVNQSWEQMRVTLIFIAL